MGAAEVIGRAVQLTPEERGPFGWMLANSFCVGFTHALFLPASGATFIERVGAHALPWVYVAASVAVPLVGIAYERLGRKLSLSALVAVNLLVTAAFGILSAVSLSLVGGKWPAFAAAVEMEVIYALGTLQFWGIAGRLFDVRQAKRLFGAMGAGEVIAILVAGLAAGPLASALGTTSLFVASAVSSIGSLVIVKRLTSVAPALHGTATGDDEAGPGGSEAPPDGAGRYRTLIFVLIALSFSAYYVVDNAFYSEAEARITDSAELAAFFGKLTAVGGLAALVIRTLITAPVLSRFGLTTGLVALPMVMAVCAAGALAGGLLGFGAVTFWLVVAIRVADKAMRESLDRSSVLVLYQPMPTQQRTKTLGVAEGVVGPGAAGLAGIGLVGLGAAGLLETRWLATAMVAIGIGWVICGVLVRKEYMRAIVSALEARRFAPDGSAPVWSAESVAIVTAGLASERPNEIIYSLTLLEEAQPAAVEPTLERLLAHPRPEVRREVLERIRLRHAAGHGSPVTAATGMRGLLLTEPDPEVRAAAVQTLLAIDETHAVDDALPLLESSEPAVLAGAVVGLLRSGGLDGILAAGDLLRRMMASVDPAERARAAHVLGEVGISEFYRSLVPLLADPVPAVRTAAAGAAQRLANQRLVPALIELVRDPECSHAAATALVAIGAPARPAIGETIRNRELPAPARAELARALGAIGGDESVAILRAVIDDPAIRTAVAKGLFEASTAATDDAAVRAAFDDEVVHLARCLVAKDVFVTHQWYAVEWALTDEVSATQATVLRLLGALRGPDLVRPAFALLAYDNAERRALAIEILDTLVAGEARRTALIALFESGSAEQRRQRLGELAGIDGNAAPEAQLVRLVLADDPPFASWTRACALHVLWLRDPNAAATTISKLTAEPDPLVAETARRPAIATTPHFKGDRMLLAIEKTLILKGAEIFSAVPGHELVRLAAIAQEQHLAAGELLFAQDTPGTSMFIVARGKVRVHDGARTLEHIGVGEAFGELAALDPAPRLRSISAVEPTLVLRIEQEPLLAVLEAHPAAMRAILRMLCRRFRVATQAPANKLETVIATLRRTMA